MTGKNFKNEILNLVQDDESVVISRSLGIVGNDIQKTYKE